MKYNNYIIYLLVLGTTFLSSCWPSDETIEPYKANLAQLSHSMYDHQTYFSFKDEGIVSLNSLDNWDIGFKCGEKGKKVILNTGKLWHAYNLGPIDITSSPIIPEEAKWIWDSSTGIPDSMAIVNWVDTTTSPFTYSNDVFVLAKAEEYAPIYKISITEVNDTQYKILLAPFESNEIDEYIISKDDNINFVKFSLEPEFLEMQVDPPSADWDILFTQYKSYIPDNSGILTPYILRGVLSNDLNTTVAVTYDNYLDITKNNLANYTFSSNLDAIGYEWKEFSGSGYFTDSERTYIIKTQYEDYYKLRFLSYNLIGRGICSFEYIAL